MRAARSVKAGYGRYCQALIRAAALAEAVRDFTAAQVAKALELIADGGLVRTGHEGVYRSVSSDGQRYYLTAVTGQCNCPGGLRGSRRCYHAAGAALLSARKAA